MINFVIEDKEDQERGPIVRVKINARKSVDGNIYIHDHPMLDIVVLTGSDKVVAFPKEEITDEVYNAQHRLFSFLRKRGVIVFDSVQGGNVYGAIEASIPEDSMFGDPVQLAVYNIAKHLEKERPGLAIIEKYRDMVEDFYFDPSVEDSTELGEVPQREEQGSMRSVSAPYGTPYRMYENTDREMRLKKLASLGDEEAQRELYRSDSRTGEEVDKENLESLARSSIAANFPSPDYVIEDFHCRITKGTRGIRVRLEVDIYEEVRDTDFTVIYILSNNPWRAIGQIWSDGIENFNGSDIKHLRRIDGRPGGGVESLEELITGLSEGAKRLLDISTNLQESDDPERMRRLAQDFGDEEAQEKMTRNSFRKGSLLEDILEEFEESFSPEFMIHAGGDLGEYEFILSQEIALGGERDWVVRLSLSENGMPNVKVYSADDQHLIYDEDFLETEVKSIVDDIELFIMTMSF